MKSILRSVGIIVASMLVIGCGVNLNPGTGEKIGQVVRLNYTGMLCDTWEGELIRGGFSDGSGAMGTAPFHFTVPRQDDNLVNLVKAAMRTQTEVSITYAIEGIYSACRSEGGQFLTSVKASKPGVVLVVE
jgi:hypothetical protein